MKTLLVLAATATLVAVAGDARSAYASPQYESDDYGFPIDPAPSTQQRTPRGQSFWAQRRAARNLRHARDYSRSVRRYARYAVQPQPSVLQAESSEMGRKMEQAQKEVAIVAKQAEDPQVAAALRSLKEHLDRAATSHERLHAECCKTAVNGEMLEHCCTEVTGQLEGVIEEYAALLRSLEGRSDEADASPK